MDRRIATVALAFVFCLDAVPCGAQQAGDWAYVGSHHARLQRGDQVVGLVPWGAAVQIEDVNGDWLWVNHQRAGWIRREAVVPLGVAIESLTHWLQREPWAWWGYVARGNAWQRRGEVHLALNDFEEAIQRYDTDYSAYQSRGVARHAQGLFRLAVADFSEALRLHPGDAWTYHLRGNAAAALGRYDEALHDQSQAIRLDPECARAYDARGAIRYDRGDYLAAIADYDTALHWDPRFAMAYHGRARAWSKIGDYRRAVDDLERGLEANPQYADGYNALAWLLSSCPDRQYRNPKRAVELARRACELTSWGQPNCVETLAAAYSEAGQDEQAARWKTMALDLASTAQYTAEWHRLLDLAQARRPLVVEYNVR